MSSSLPPGTREAMDRLRNFLLVNAHQNERVGIPALVAFGELVGLDRDGQLEVFGLLEGCGFHPLSELTGAIYLGFLVGALAGQEAALSAPSEA